MDFLYEFAVDALAVWTLASLLTGERGPSAVFERLRKAFGVTAKKDADAAQLNQWLAKNPDKTEEDIPDCFSFNEVGMALCCIWCTTMWTAFVVTLYSVLNGWTTWQWAPVYAFALRSAALLINMTIERLDVPEK